MDTKIIVLSRRELLQATARFGLSGAALAAFHSARAGERRTPALALPEHREGGSDKMPFVLGYYPDWKPLDPVHLDLDAYTHICHAFARITKNGSLHFPAEEQTRALVDAAHARKIKVLLSVGGADSGASLRAQQTDPFADALAQRIHAGRYDGVDLDWEFPENDAETAKLSALAQALRKRLPHTLLTLAVPATNYYGKWFPTDTLLPLADWLNIMTYDFCGPWCDKVLHNAPMPEVTASIDYWKGKGWPMQKLLLGIPAYGKRIHAARFGDPAPVGTYEADEVAFNDMAKYLKDGWKTMLDAEAQVPYLVKPEGGELITYEDVASSVRKGQLAHKRGLRGVFFWEMTSDFDGKTHLLARAARKGWSDPNP